MNTEQTIQDINKKLELITKAFTKTVNMLEDMRVENVQLKRDVQVLREDMNSGLSEQRLRATLRKSYEDDGVSGKDFVTYYDHFNSTANGIGSRLDRVEKLIKDESVKVQNASYTSGRSSMFA